MARPPTASYRLQKAIRRNKLTFASGLVVTAGLVAGLSLALVAWSQARLERDDAVTARASEAAQRHRAEVNAHEAKEARAREAAARAETQAHLYRSLIGQAKGLRLSRRTG